MKAGEWECFEKWVTNQEFKIADCGPLYGPAISFSITRNAELKLILETTSEGDSATNLIPVPAGTVDRANNQVKFEGRFGAISIARGVIPFSWKESWSQAVNRREKREKSSVHALEWTARSANESHYMIEWFENMSGDFLWPDLINERTTEEIQRIFRSPKTEIVYSSHAETKRGGRTCVHLSVEGFDLFIGTSHNINAENISHPGYILYKGNPSEDVRERIRDCLSFSLGMHLIYLGYTCFDEQWAPVSFKAVSAYALSKNDIRSISMPPAPLGFEYEGEIAAELLERMVSSLYLNYDAYNFRSVFWAYWHAVAAPVHMSAVHFGAAIESLQSTYFKNPAVPINKFILDKTSWDKLSEKLDELEDIIAALDVPLLGKGILSNKLKKLNTAPQDVILSRFLEALKIKIDEIEKSAWKNRNRAAHGGSISEKNSIKVIRENKALRVLMNRILLAIVNGSDSYYDYYTLGRPISYLADSIPKN